MTLSRPADGRSSGAAFDTYTLDVDMSSVATWSACLAASLLCRLLTSACLRRSNAHTPSDVITTDNGGDDTSDMLWVRLTEARRVAETLFFEYHLPITMATATAHAFDDQRVLCQLTRLASLAGWIGILFAFVRGCTAQEPPPSATSSSTSRQSSS
jgi:hypothetical protein